jgi:uncharacterized protein (DUF983 family)
MTIIILVICIGAYLSAVIVTSITLWASLIVAKEADATG